MRFDIMKWLFVLIIGVGISTGCGQRDTQPTAPPTSGAQTAEIVATIPPTTGTPVEAEVTSASEPEQAASPEIPDPTPAEPTALPPSATSEPDLAGQQESDVPEAVTFNGVYENSYFRGAADAPVTILDYSDFL
jgi:hypothetical protein